MTQLFVVIGIVVALVGAAGWVYSKGASDNEKDNRLASIEALQEAKDEHASRARAEAAGRLAAEKRAGAIEADAAAKVRLAQAAADAAKQREDGQCPDLCYQLGLQPPPLQ